MRNFKTMVFVMFFCFGYISTSLPLAFAEALYIGAKKAQLRAGKTSLDQTVATLDFGDQVEVIEKSGSWLKVKTRSGVMGWIYINKVTALKPSNRSGPLASLGRIFRRTEASEITATAGARGLDKVSEDYANRVGITEEHREAVDRMTGYQLSDQEFEVFLKEGRLGEYAQ